MISKELSVAKNYLRPESAPLIPSYILVGENKEGYFRLSKANKKINEFILANKMTNWKRIFNSITNCLMLPVEILRTVLTK